MDEEIPTHIDIDENDQAEATEKDATDASNVPVPIDGIQEMRVERKSESSSSSEGTSAHFLTHNLGYRRSSRRSSVSFEVEMFRNELKLMSSKYLAASAKCGNIYRKDAGENDAVPVSVRRRLTYDEADRELNPSVNSYRDKKCFSSNSSENAESESSIVSDIESLGQRFVSIPDEIQNSVPCLSDNFGFSGILLPELLQKSSSTLTQECEKLTENDYKAKVNYYFEKMAINDSSLLNNSPEKDNCFGTKDDIDEEYIPDTESAKSSECQKGTTISYKSFTNPEKSKTFGKRKYDDNGYLPGGESTSSSEHLKSTAKSRKLSRQIDYPKGRHFSIKREPLLSFSSMESQLDEISQIRRKPTQRAKNSLNAACPAFIPTTEEINTSNSHEVSLEEERMNTITRINTETSHINKPTVPKEKRYSSTPELRETSTANLEVSRKDSLYKSCSFTDSQTEHMLTVEGESVNNSCEQYSRKRKVDSSKNSPSDDRKEKFFKTV